MDCHVVKTDNIDYLDFQVSGSYLHYSFNFGDKVNCQNMHI